MNTKFLLQELRHSEERLLELLGITRRWIDTVEIENESEVHSQDAEKLNPHKMQLSGSDKTLPDTHSNSQERLPKDILNAPDTHSTKNEIEKKEGCNKVISNPDSKWELRCGDIRVNKLQLCDQCNIKKSTESEVKPIILDDNEISIAKYAEEYQENWNAMQGFNAIHGDIASVRPPTNSVPQKAVQNGFYETDSGTAKPEQYGFTHGFKKNTISALNTSRHPHNLRRKDEDLAETQKHTGKQGMDDNQRQL